jgi:hypothetical protein
MLAKGVLLPQGVPDGIWNAACVILSGGEGSVRSCSMCSTAKKLYPFLVAIAVDVPYEKLVELTGRSMEAGNDAFIKFAVAICYARYRS